MQNNEVKKERRKPRGLRDDKRIQVTYTDGRRPDGKPNRISFYGSTRLEATSKRDAYIREKEAGIFPSAKETTVSQWIDRWVELYSIDLNNYGTYINKLKNDLGKVKISNIQEGHLVQTLNSYSGMSKSAASKYRMTIKRIFSKARKNHLIAEDPSDDLELPANTTSGTHRALETWESDAIIQHHNIHRAGLWAMLMMLCGLRRGELIALDWDSINMQHRQIEVHSSAVLKSNQPIIKPHTKSRAGMRTLPICDQLFMVLSEIPEDKRKGAVCTSASGQRLTQTAFLNGWASFCNVITRIINGEEPDQRGRRNDIEKEKNDLRIVFSCRPHDLRHTYATALYDAGVDIKSAQYYLGHADIKMTQDLYTHLSKERENKARSTLVNYLDNWLEKHASNA